MKEKELIALQKEREQNGSVITFHKEDLKPYPEIGKIYYVYDDGKINLTREYQVKILDKIHAKNLPDNLRKEWEESVIECYWLYSPIEDYIFLGEVISENLQQKEIEYFCRTKDGGWFGFSALIDPWTSGRLDVTGELRKLVFDER